MRESLSTTTRDTVQPQPTHASRHALMAERIRIRHIEKALACATDGSFRERCEEDLASSLTRALYLERTIRSAADAAEHNTHGHVSALQLGECLLSAMDLARANGDPGAAETVAQECLALVELHCRTLEAQHPAGRAGELASFLEGAVET